MNRLSFNTFSEVATGNSPYDYQSRLAGGDAGRSCESQLVSIPTGLGKTAAVVLTWLRSHVEKLIPLIAANYTKYLAVRSAIVCKTGISRGHPAASPYRNSN